MYLKSEQHYADEYDRETVRLCRDRETRYKQRHEEMVARGDDPHWAELLYKLSIYFDVDFLVGERWEHKTQVIQERMNRDLVRDTLLATSDPPDHIRCLVCRAKMKVVGKELDEAPAGGQDRVIFFFECL